MKICFKSINRLVVDWSLSEAVCQLTWYGLGRVSEDDKRKKIISTISATSLTKESNLKSFQLPKLQQLQIAIPTSLRQKVL